MLKGNPKIYYGILSFTFTIDKLSPLITIILSKFIDTGVPHMTPRSSVKFCHHTEKQSSGVLKNIPYLDPSQIILEFNYSESFLARRKLRSNSVRRACLCIAV